MVTNRSRAFRYQSQPFFLLMIIILANLVIGCLVVTDYGESRDESLRYDYAGRSLAAYTSGKKMNMDEKGPLYVMLARLGAEGLRSVWNGLRPIEAWHFMHFLSFLMGVISLFWICRRMMSAGAALGATLLFNTQPVLWGHAWINPKDIPFMAFFLASVALGMHMIDGLERSPTAQVSQSLRLRGLPAVIVQDWTDASSRKRLVLTSIAALALALLLGIILGSSSIQRWIGIWVENAYAAGDSSPAGRLLAGLAENTGSIPAALYVQKAQAAFRRMVQIEALLTPLVGLFCAGVLLPQTRALLWREGMAPFLRASLLSAADRRTVLAALFLGFVAAIRALGPASGLLVAVYALSKSGRRALPALLAYFILACLVTYAAWPGLWRAPVRGYLSAIGEASDFPWDGKVLFAGMDYPASELPRSYLPALLALQFSEPALALFGVGLILAASRFWRDKRSRPALGIMALWFFAPLAATMAVTPTLYDNFRQFLFIVPPLFIFSGFGLQELFGLCQRLGRPFSGKASSAVPGAVSAILLAALLWPGIYWDVKLHPYQYAYYNQLAGGVGGAFRRFEMDYWSTSYKEATEYLNAGAPKGARVIVWGADQIVQEYARPDLEISEYPKGGPAPQDFAVITTRHNKDLELYPRAPVVFQVGRQGAIFTVVKRLSPADSAQP